MRGRTCADVSYPDLFSYISNSLQILLENARPSLRREGRQPPRLLEQLERMIMKKNKRTDAGEHSMTSPRGHQEPKREG